MDPNAATYRFDSAQPSHMHTVFVPPILARLRELKPLRILDLGCGNGSLCRMIRDAGFNIEGVDPSAEGIGQARASHPDIPFHQMSVDGTPPQEWLGSFDVVVSTEVVEHLYNPRAMPRLAAQLLKPGGVILVTTPYHGYWKNLALCLAGKWDHHHNPLWDHGHIKFWSKQTLKALFEERGFRTVGFQGLGRFPGLWMTMLMEFVAPAASAD